MSLPRSLRVLALSTVLAIGFHVRGDDKDLLKKGSAPPNVMVILSNTDSMKYMPYLQGSPPNLINLPTDGQYGDSPASKFGLAKAAFSLVVQQNRSRFNFGLSWYSFHGEQVFRKHFSYQLTGNQTIAGAAYDFPGDTFKEAVGTFEEWGKLGNGPILSTAGGIETFGVGGTTLSGFFFTDAAPGATGTCTTATCSGYAFENITGVGNFRIAVHAVPAPSGQPYGNLTVTVIKEYQKQTGFNYATQATTPAGNPGRVSLTYSAAPGDPNLPNIYSTGPDVGKYMGFMKSGDWDVQDDCGGWFLKANPGYPVVDIPRDYASNYPNCSITTCAVPAQDSYGCVLRYMRPQSAAIGYAQPAGTYTPTIVPDPPGATCSPGLVYSTLTAPENQVILLNNHASHIPESNMFKNIDDYFSTLSCMGNGVRSDDPSKTCRTGAIILLSDTFDACGPNCGQLATAKYLISLKSHHVPVYVISFGELDGPTATAQEAHCIATTSGSETATSQGVFFISSTDPTQVASDLQQAFAAILTKIDEAVEDFASATISSVQAGNGQMAFLATFNARKNRSIWEGALRGYKLRDDGSINPPPVAPSTVSANPDGTPCVTTIKDPNDPQLNKVLDAPCNQFPILRWNAEINMASVPVVDIASNPSGVADLAPGSALQTGSKYSDGSNDTAHSIPVNFYTGRRIIWSLPNTVASAAGAPANFPLNGSVSLEPVPEIYEPFLVDTAKSYWPKLKLLMTPQGNPPTTGQTPCATLPIPCAITDTDAGQSVRFIRGDRDSVTKELRVAAGQPNYPVGDTHYYDSPSGQLKLGDIFHSNPQLIGEPQNYFYFASDQHNYSKFFKKNAHRRRVLYAGGNDGLLHAFDVGVWDRDITACVAPLNDCYDFGTGAELFAYAPRSIMQNFKRLKNARGPQSTLDEWTVDGAPSADDMFIDTNHGGTPVAANRDWRTVIVGTTREGSPFEGRTTAYDLQCQSVSTTAFQNNGSSVYALDVTTPEPVDAQGVQANGSTASPGCLNGGANCNLGPWPKVLWEIQDPTTDASGYLNMGESWSKPGLGRICVARDAANVCTDERFVAIFGGGFDRERRNRRGNYLYIVDVETGFVLYKANSGTSDLGTTNFASIPSETASIDFNGDGYLDFVYVGDLLGRMWRLDLRSVALPAGAPTDRWSSKLKKADGSALSAFLLFQAPQVANRLYPIYYRPAVISLGLTNSGSPKFGIAFGTGDRDDVPAKCPSPATNPTRSITYNERYYYVIDDSNTVTVTETTPGMLQIANDSAPNVTTNPSKGWYLILGTYSNVAAERVITNSLVINKYIYFFTYSPASTPTVVNCPPPGSCSDNGGLARGYVVYYANGNAYPGGGRGGDIKDASFVTDPIFYVSGNGTGHVGYTTNHGTFKSGLAPGNTKGTVKNWKEK